MKSMVLFKVFITDITSFKNNRASGYWSIYREDKYW